MTITQDATLRPHLQLIKELREVIHGEIFSQTVTALVNRMRGNGEYVQFADVIHRTTRQFTLSGGDDDLHFVIAATPNAHGHILFNTSLNSTDQRPYDIRSSTYLGSISLRHDMLDCALDLIKSDLDRVLDKAEIYTCNDPQTFIARILDDEFLAELDKLNSPTEFLRDPMEQVAMMYIFRDKGTYSRMSEDLNSFGIAEVIPHIRIECDYEKREILLIIKSISLSGRIDGDLEDGSNIRQWVEDVVRDLATQVTTRQFAHENRFL